MNQFLARSRLLSVFADIISNSKHLCVARGLVKVSQVE